MVKMGRLQELRDNYMDIKRTLCGLEKIENEIEKKYIMDHNILNANGRLPTCITEIEDNFAYKLATDECRKQMNGCGLYELRNLLKVLLKTTEDHILHCGLLILSRDFPELAEKLKTDAENNITTRDILFDVILKSELDFVYDKAEPIKTEEEKNDIEWGDMSM